MADILIKHLKKKSEEHSSLQLLWNQWGFDEKLIPKALQTIVSIFPHYSRHDESHSRQILINIERILGENISLLTATDTWLLLEAAYWHDIGMVVSGDHINEAYNDKDFHEFINSIANNAKHELYEIAAQILSHKNTGNFNSEKSPIENFDNFKLLISEWFRQKHARRAFDIVQNPWERSGLSSPRTELIPSRLFSLLGRICQMHGASFDEITSDDILPFREMGLAQEDCHPRFIACMLRLGDLLDMDDNRFCPVMQKIMGDRKPSLTAAHEDKHSSIRHLRIDRELIEVTAECKTVDGYIETSKWLDWLKQELHSQMLNWQKIAPSRELGLLPTLGKIKVNLERNLIVLAEGEQPKFNLDSNAIQELIKGSNIYESSASCIRELLQNAVDATIIKNWHENGKSQDSTWSQPGSQEALKCLSKQEVFISIERNKEADPSAEESAWTIKISDKGTGISRSDLGHLLKVGSSSKNKEKQRIIQSMPEWLKPSGTFGIGFQSVFLLTDEVNITSKSILNNEKLKILLSNPTGLKGGAAIITLEKTDSSEPCGTEISFQFKTKKIADRYSLSFDQHSVVRKVIEYFDPVIHDEFSIETAKLAEAVDVFSKNCLVKITGHVKLNEEIQYTFEQKNKEEIDYYYTEHNKVPIRITKALQFQKYSRSIEWLYRGQPFEMKKHLDIGYTSFGIDILGGTASKWLKTNRDGIKNDATDEIIDLLYHGLRKLVHDQLTSTEKSKHINDKLYSRFVNLMAAKYPNEWEELAELAGKEWESLNITDDDKSFLDLKNSEKESIIIATHHSQTNPITNQLDIDHIFDDEDNLRLTLKAWCKSYKNSITISSRKITTRQLGTDGTKETDIKVYNLTRESNTPQLDNNGLALILKRAVDYYGKRVIISTNDVRWKNLALKKDCHIRATIINESTSDNSYCILLPFLLPSKTTFGSSKVKEDDLTKLHAALKGKLKTELAINEFRETYSKFIDFIREIASSSKIAALSYNNTEE